jgi:hypothetical protein
VAPVEFDGVGTLFAEDLGGFGGVDWAIPVFAMTVPGLLLILAVLAQATAGVFWLPFVRRWLGSFGVRRRRHEPSPAR